MTKHKALNFMCVWGGHKTASKAREALPCPRATR
jgi:hypothetical protein